VRGGEVGGWDAAGYGVADQVRQTFGSGLFC